MRNRTVAFLLHNDPKVKRPRCANMCIRNPESKAILLNGNRPSFLWHSTRRQWS